MLNYWLLTTEYPPFHGGGISTYAGFTTFMLAEKNSSITVFAPDSSIPDHTEIKIADSISLVRFNPDRNGLSGSLGYTALLSYAFADIIRFFISEKGKPDVIESQDYLGIAYYLTQFKHAGYAFIQDVPIVITLHSPAFLYLEYNRVPVFRFPDFWTCEMEKQSIKAADLLLSPTSFLIGAIEKYMEIGSKKLHVLANPFKDHHDNVTRSFKRNKIIYYGKLSPQKGSFEMLSYFKDLWDKGFEHTLYIVGGTDIVYHPEMRTMGQLVERAYAHYIKRGLLVLKGKVNPFQIAEAIGDAHVILVPSIVDNLPYVIMEAMSLCKIVLASRQGGQREMIEDGVTGFLFDHDDPLSFSLQLKKILALSDEAIRFIGKNARKHIQEAYSFDTIGNQKISILKALISERMENNLFPFLHQEKRTTISPAVSEKELLSVVIPFYNMGKYIEECIDSVWQSDYRPIEIIIVNDGSTFPADLEYLGIAARREGVRVVHQENKGLAETRNHGARIASGDYLAFLDADDKVAPSYYSQAIRALKKNDNVFFVGSWVQYFENSSYIWPSFTPQPPYALIHNPVNSSGLVYKRYAFLAGGCNDTKTDYGLEDYESVINMLHHGFNGIALPEVLFYYRVRTGSMIRNISTEKLIYSNKYIAEKHRDYYAKFAAELINLLNANGPGYLFDNPTLEVKVTSQVIRDNRMMGTIKSFVKKNKRLKNIALMIKKIKR